MKYSPFGNHNVNIEYNKKCHGENRSDDNDNHNLHANQNQKEEEQNKHNCHGYVFATTVAENEILMKELFDAKPTVYKPNIPNLVYQYELYTNCYCNTLNKENPEICLV